MPWWTGPPEDWWYSVTRGRREARAYYPRRAFVSEAAARGEAHAGSERDIHGLVREAAGSRATCSGCSYCRLKGAVSS